MKGLGGGYCWGWGEFGFGGGDFFLGSGVGNVDVNVMFQGLFLEGNDVGEIDDRHACHTLLHKFNPDGKSGLRTAFAFTQGNLLVVVADPNACGDLRREADEPRVREVLRGAGLAASGSANGFGFHRGTELNDFFEHGGHGVRHCPERARRALPDELLPEARHRSW